MSAALFAAVAALAREEHALVTEQRWDELAGLGARRERLMAMLPPVAPPEALADLREAARLQALITVALREARDATAAELHRLGRTRTGVQGYVSGSGAAAPSRRAFDAAL